MDALAATSSPVRTLASQGLKAMTSAYDQADARKEGDRFLRSVSGDASVTALERLVAETTRTAAARNLASSSAVGAQRAALKALAAGVGGPVGVALAGLGSQALAGAYDQEDQRAMAPSYLAAIRDHGTAVEKLVAEAALESTRINLANSSAVGTQKAAFEMVTSGLPASPEAAVGGLGAKALARAYDQEDQRAMGRALLGVLSRAGGDPTVDALAAAARDASGLSLANSSGVAVQKKALELAQAPPAGDPEVLFAKLGTSSLSGAYDNEDGRAIGRSLLTSLSKSAKSAVSAAVAEVAVRATNVNLANQSAAGLHRRAFAQIEAGTGSDTVEVALARLGASADKVAYDVEDARAMGRLVMDEIGKRTGDAQIQSLVTFARTYAGGGASDSEARKVQQQIFDQIVKGNMTVPAPPATARPAASSGPRSGAAPVDTRVMIPQIGPEMSPDDQIDLLEKAIEHNKKLDLQMDAEAGRLSGRLAQIQTERAPLAARINDIAQKEEVFVKRINTVGKVVRWGFFGGIGALLGFNATHSVFAGVVAAGGMGAAVVGSIYRKSLERQRHEAVADYHDLRFKYDMLGIEEAGLGAQIDGYRQVGEQARKQNEAAQGKLDVLRMARTVNRTHVDPNAKVEIEDAYLTIGGIRVPKKTEQP